VIERKDKRTRKREIKRISERQIKHLKYENDEREKDLKEFKRIRKNKVE